MLLWGEALIQGDILHSPRAAADQGGVLNTQTLPVLSRSCLILCPLCTFLETKGGLPSHILSGTSEWVWGIVGHSEGGQGGEAPEQLITEERYHLWNKPTCSRGYGIIFSAKFVYM